MEELRSWRFLLKNECCRFWHPQFLENTASLAFSLVVVGPGTKGFVSFAFLGGSRCGRVEIGSEHEEDVYEIGGQVKEAGNSKKGVPFNL